MRPGRYETNIWKRRTERRRILLPTPLYDCLKELASQHPLRFDMPGHHGAPLPGNLADASLDFTENGRTGDLFGPGGDVIEGAERLWAASLGFDSCLFLTGGSTQGIHTGLALLAGVGGVIALDRGSHRAAYNALALLGLVPHYLPRPWVTDEGVTGPIEPEQVEQTLRTHPEIKTICIVSPTYYGVISDLPAIARVCHSYGARLMVDGAHGAHLPFLGYRGYQAADLVVMSAMGQTALLLANGLTMEELRRMGSVYGSSSPSYLMMASLDLARDWMAREGADWYGKVVEGVASLRNRFPCLRPGPLKLDPARLVVRCSDGFALAETLRQENIFPEMADRNHVVFILTAAERVEAVARLEAVLAAALDGDHPPQDFSDLIPPPFPQQTLTPRQALFAPRQTVPLSQSRGCVCACQAAPYPPGIPVVAPGERIGKKHLAYLERIGYNRSQIEVIATSNETKEGSL